MSYTVRATDLKNIRFAEQDTVSSVLQNVALILSTPKGSVPQYREFGLDWSYLDKPMPIAKVLMLPEVKEAIEHWEPRAKFVDMSLAEDPLKPGTLFPTVEIEIKGEKNV